MQFKNSLVRLRLQNNLSQEKLAEQLQVSRQTIQKWENGTEVPELAHIIRIAKRFGVTTDSLILSSDVRMCEGLQPNIQINPDYGALDSWESYAADLQVEFRQCCDEGLDIKPYRSLFHAVQQMPAGSLKTRMGDVLFDLIMSLPGVSDYRYDEPSDLDDILSLCRCDNTWKQCDISYEKLEKKIRGAWVGRICGCLLGKPIEGIRTNRCDERLLAPLPSFHKGLNISAWHVRSQRAEPCI